MSRRPDTQGDRRGDVIQLVVGDLTEPATKRAWEIDLVWKASAPESLTKPLAEEAGISMNQG
jgi:hypothetical protein